MHKKRKQDWVKDENGNIKFSKSEYEVLDELRTTNPDIAGITPAGKKKKKEPAKATNSFIDSDNECISFSDLESEVDLELEVDNDDDDDDDHVATKDDDHVAAKDDDDDVAAKDDATNSKDDATKDDDDDDMDAGAGAGGKMDDHGRATGGVNHSAKGGGGSGKGSGGSGNIAHEAGSKKVAMEGVEAQPGAAALAEA